MSKEVEVQGSTVQWFTVISAMRFALCAMLYALCALFRAFVANIN
jgi:hypothetical protein